MAAVGPAAGRGRLPPSSPSAHPASQSVCTLLRGDRPTGIHESEVAAVHYRF